MENLSIAKSLDAGFLSYSTPSMSQARGAMFDQFLHYFFQNLPADLEGGRDEVKGFSCSEELRIEVSRL